MLTSIRLIISRKFQKIIESNEVIEGATAVKFLMQNMQRRIRSYTYQICILRKSEDLEYHIMRRFCQFQQDFSSFLFTGVDNYYYPT